MSTFRNEYQALRGAKSSVLIRRNFWHPAVPGNRCGRYRFRQNSKIAKNLLLLAMSHFSGFGGLFVQIGPNLWCDHYTIWGSTLRGRIRFNPTTPLATQLDHLKKIHHIHTYVCGKGQKTNSRWTIFAVKQAHYPTICTQPDHSTTPLATPLATPLDQLR